MNYFAFITAIAIVAIAAGLSVEYGKPLLVLLGIQSDERQ